jgi:APA family basic amino acid/polyamine antiporter
VESTILTGTVVGLAGALLPLRMLAELVNIGTLLAFVIVCAAVLIIRRTDPAIPRPFLCPLVPLLGIAFARVIAFSTHGNWPWDRFVCLAHVALQGLTYEDEALL